MMFRISRLVLSGHTQVIPVTETIWDLRLMLRRDLAR
jgi:hypothetical protein